MKRFIVEKRGERYLVAERKWFQRKLILRKFKSAVDVWKYLVKNYDNHRIGVDFKEGCFIDDALVMAIQDSASKG
jgi:hypothetical protein